MLVTYTLSLAPIVILLLGAFILSIIIPRLPEKWRSHRGMQYFLAPGLVALAGLLFLGQIIIEINGGPEILLSGWYFSIEGTGAALALLAGATSIPFLLLTILVLLVITLTALPIENGQGLGWIMILGASALLIFSAANSPTLVYMLLAFDALLAFYWFNRQFTDLSVARLFLSIITVSAVIFNESLSGTPEGLAGGTLFLGLVLWLRLGFYPLMEISRKTHTSDTRQTLVYWTLSPAVGVYLTASILTSIPNAITWLIMLTLLLNGLLSWLAESESNSHNQLTRLAIMATLLPLLITNHLNAYIISSYAVGIILSFTVLWITPLLKKKLGFEEWQSLWPYLPALFATLILVGLPFSLTWPVFTAFYANLFSKNVIITAPVTIAVTLTLSGLAHYWILLWQQEKTAVAPKTQQYTIIAALMIAAVPFLIPGLGPLIFSALTHIKPNTTVSLTPALIAISTTMIGAIALSYFRPHIVQQIKLNNFQPRLIDILELNGLILWLEKIASRIGKFILRINIILEGRHYIGWALFMALVGGLIILLTRI